MTTLQTALSPLLLTTREAASVLGIGQTKCRALIADGTLESVWIGRSLRIPAQGCADLVETLRGEAPKS